MTNARSLFADGAKSDAYGNTANVKIAFFGHERNEPTIVKRATAFLTHGARVTGFMFTRRRNKADREPAWRNIDLGVTEDGNYLKRLPRLVRGIWEVLRHRSELRAADIIYARNLDMLLVAILAKHLARSRAPVVYEFLDVQEACMGNGARSRLLRFVEGCLLTGTELVVVSSPDYIHKYFEPMHTYRGPWFLLENKIVPQQLPPSTMDSGDTLKAGPPWTIGWFGVLKCERSLQMLCEIAQSLGDKVRIVLRGTPSEPDNITPSVLAQLSDTYPNIVYHGPYINPTDLPKIYSRIHLTWGADYRANTSNSIWCLPNRVYESGLHAVPLLVRRSTATGDLVARERLGWALEEPFAASVAALLTSLDVATYQRAVEGMIATDRAVFLDEHDTRNLLSELSLLASGVVSHRKSNWSAGQRETQDGLRFDRRPKS